MEFYDDGYESSGSITTFDLLNTYPLLKKSSAGWS